MQLPLLSSPNTHPLPQPIAVMQCAWDLHGLISFPTFYVSFILLTEFVDGLCACLLSVHVILFFF